MADEKQFSESEHIAILTDRVATETAGLTAERDRLTTENADLQSKLDVAESAKVAAEQAAADVQKAFDEFKAEVDAERQKAARKDERIAMVRDVAKHLEDSFFEDPQRVERIVAMADDQFEGYIADLGATAPAGSGSTGVPRQTAMDGNPPAVDTKSNTRAFLARARQSSEA